MRPLDEVARFLGGPRPVTVVAPPSEKAFDLSVVVPVEDMAAIGEASDDPASGSASGLPDRSSIWPHIDERLVELIRAHRSTIVFANSRRLAERLCANLNELAETELARAHHGSVSREQRTEIEEDLKAGRLPAVVATSSLELGIDMGAVDLVIQVESPSSVASGLQRIGRAGHQVGAVSRGIVFPKFRGDLVESAVVVERMRAGAIEAMRYPRNPLDVLAQQVVAMVAMDDWTVDDLEALVRRAAPFAELPRSALDSVLDMLSGRYPSDEFAELRPRLNWDRTEGRLAGRPGAQRLAVTSGGTIPDRGLFGVFLVGERATRVGELDEEMVYESRVGRGVHPGRVGLADRGHHPRPGAGLPGPRPAGQAAVLARRHAGPPGRAGPGPRRVPARAVGPDAGGADRAAAGGRAGRLRRRATSAPTWTSSARRPGCCPTTAPSWSSASATSWATGGSASTRPSAPRSTPPGPRPSRPGSGSASASRSRPCTPTTGWWSGSPRSTRPRAAESILFDPDEIEDLVVGEVGGSALFASRFRECAARALLLPRRRPDRRTPLWQQRQRSAGLLQVASKYGSFPVVLETMRECLQDVFDLPGLKELMAQVASRQVRVVEVDTPFPSPFASSLQFGYVAAFMYEGDAPLAERRAQALSLDRSVLAELLGREELRDLIDQAALADLELELQLLTPDRKVRDPDGLHDALRLLGDLTRPGGGGPQRRPGGRPGWLAELEASRRALRLRVGGQERWVAIEDVARLRDGLGAAPPVGVPRAFLEPVADPVGDLLARYARTHGPFLAEDPARRLGLGVAVVSQTLARLEAAGRVVEGEFRPGGSGREWLDAEVLRRLRRRSLAALRREVEPVPQEAMARFLGAWQGVGPAGPRSADLDALFRVVEQLQGAAVPASALERQVLAARLPGYHPGLLDQLCASGEVVWAGAGALGSDDGWVGLYLAEGAPLLLPEPLPVELSPLATQVREALAARGAMFFRQLSDTVGPANDSELLLAVWELVWAGHATNDTLAPLRALVSGGSRPTTRRRPPPAATAAAGSRSPAAPAPRPPPAAGA